MFLCTFCVVGLVLAGQCVHTRGPGQCSHFPSPEDSAVATPQPPQGIDDSLLYRLLNRYKFSSNTSRLQLVILQDSIK